MYNNVEAQSVAPKPPSSSQPNPFGNAFYGAGSGLIRGGLGAYGEKIFGSSSEYVQSNVSTSYSVNLSPSMIYSSKKDVEFYRNRKSQLGESG